MGSETHVQPITLAAAWQMDCRAWLGRESSFSLVLFGFSSQSGPGQGRGWRREDSARRPSGYGSRRLDD